MVYAYVRTWVFVCTGLYVCRYMCVGRTKVNFRWHPEELSILFSQTRFTTGLELTSTRCWLIGEPQRSTCPWLPSIGIINIHYNGWLDYFTWLLAALHACTVYTGLSPQTHYYFVSIKTIVFTVTFSCMYTIRLCAYLSTPSWSRL